MATEQQVKVAEIAEQLASIAPHWKLLPMNPFYSREYATTVSSGVARLSLPAPGNELQPEDAADMIDWVLIYMKHHVSKKAK